RRDGAPLQQDCMFCLVGHDLPAGDVLNGDKGNIQSGWPRRHEEYPPGFGVSDPPGFCFPHCDCMDDQRPQKPWETSKPWLEDPTRTAAVNASIDALTAQARFVRRRGQVTKMCSFETNTIALGDQTHVRASLDLAGIVERLIRDSLKDIPLSAISDPLSPVRIPARAFLGPEMDYEPQSFSFAAVHDGLAIGTDDGHLSVVGAGPPARPMHFRIEFFHSEGQVATADCAVVDRQKTAQSPWSVASASLVRRFMDGQNCQLVRSARIVLHDHLTQVFDFGTRTPKELSFGVWLSAMSKILRLLRSTAVANLVKTEASSRPPSGMR
ncbi:unnamed protein product, partial [Polarella glacialis]